VGGFCIDAAAAAEDEDCSALAIVVAAEAALALVFSAFSLAFFDSFFFFLLFFFPAPPADSSSHLKLYEGKVEMFMLPSEIYYMYMSVAPALLQVTRFPRRGLTVQEKVLSRTKRRSAPFRS
jgi:hypothetical protein